MSNINIDYDDTFTTDPYAWTKILNILFDRTTNKIYCISQRSDTIKNMEELQAALPYFVEIHLTSHTGKRDWAIQHGIVIDIWIENNPDAIFRSDRDAL